MEGLGLIDPLYYLHNFETALAELERRDEGVLDTGDGEWIQAFCHLPTASRALLTRLIMRSADLIRWDNLRYAEIGPLEDAAAPLKALGWIVEGGPLDLDNLFTLFTKEDLCVAFRVPRAWLGKPKALLKQALAKHRQDDLAVDTVALARRSWHVRARAQCEELQALYFGNFHQQWREFILADLKVRRYESVTYNGRPFETRRQVECFKSLARCRKLLTEGALAQDIEALLPGVVGDCNWLEERRQECGFSIGRLYERQGNRAGAAMLYAGLDLREARERLRILQGQTVRRGKNAGSRFGETPMFEQLVTRAARGRGVEYDVRRSLLAASPDSQVYYVENSLICSLFGLLCWRAIFAPVRGAFFHRFHRAPADLSGAGFLERRREIFDECLAELASGSYRETIYSVFRQKRGIACMLVTWRAMGKTLLALALECIPPAHLQVYFQYLLLNIRENCSGFPDLIQFWPKGEYRLIEVKGPKDRLQPSQQRCLEYLHARGLPVSICRPRVLANVEIHGGHNARRCTQKIPGSVGEASAKPAQLALTFSA